MKRTIILEYLKTLIFSVFASVVLSAAICFFSFFNNQSSIDEDMPQFLIRSIEQYITINGSTVTLNEDGMKRLSKYQLWLQVIDAHANAIYETNVPNDVPHSYSNFQLIDYVLQSNRLNGYTIFACPLSEHNDYGVLIGCDSNLVTKYTHTLFGTRKERIGKCLLIFLFTTAIVIFFASYYFSKKVTKPISRALENIEEIQSGREITVNANEPLFSNIFASLQKLENELKKNECLRAEWITNISHDIKTPLSTIKGYAELLSCGDYSFEREELLLYAEQILKSEERIEELVGELKMSQLLAEGKFNLNLETISLTDLIQKCMEETARYVKYEPNINFTYEKHLKVMGDRKLLERCLVNIICNAYVHNSETVQVKIILSDEKESDKIKITISDNGKGMSQKDQDHIFERYYRGTNSSTVKGTGLGLAIAREVIVAHGWEIRVSSALGMGTTFTILI